MRYSALVDTTKVFQNDWNNVPSLQVIHFVGVPTVECYILCTSLATLGIISLKSFSHFIRGVKARQCHFILHSPDG